MWIKFYTDERLRYTGRVRYLTIPSAIRPRAYSEVQSFVYGDGVSTEFVWNNNDANIHTVEDSWLVNVTYITISTMETDASSAMHFGIEHKWFVTGYEIENGGCIRFRLLRDVVGEFGLEGIYGKIERGFATGIFEHRKELSLNQILTNRTRLVSGAENYGSVKILSPDRDSRNEMWGILYMKKPAPLPGSSAPTEYRIPIPGYQPSLTPSCPTNLAGNPPDDPPIKHVASEQYLRSFTITFEIDTIILKSHGVFEQTPAEKRRRYIIAAFEYDGNGDESFKLDYYQVNDETLIEDVSQNKLDHLAAYFLVTCPIYEDAFNTYYLQIKQYIIDKIGAALLHALQTDISLDLTTFELVSAPQWGGAVFKREDDSVDPPVEKYYRYSTSQFEEKYFTNENLDQAGLKNIINTIGTPSGIEPDWNDFQISFSGEGVSTSITADVSMRAWNEPNFIQVNKNKYQSYYYIETELNPTEVGTLIITPPEDFIDEPYKVIITPLFDCTLKYGNNTYTIDKDMAFNVFNNVIEQSSGENSYLVDAQIYPYCPVLDNIVGNFEIKTPGTNIVTSNALFFNVTTTSYTHSMRVELPVAYKQSQEGGMPYGNDIKMTYMTRLYSIVSPDKSAKFDFNIYDYKNIISSDNTILVKIKTALKPFAIISSAIIEPEEGSLMGIPYYTDMRGCNPSSGGFECSIATNMFEQYKRQNSNYQQIFALQKGELQVSHEVERVNEQTNAIVNTMTATAMGAIGGAAMGGAFGPIGKGIGAAAGGLAAGATVGVAMYGQYKANEKLRDYEENLQQQNFDLNIGTVKNLPNSVTRISTFNEIIMSEFNYYIEVYSCSRQEEAIVERFRQLFGDQIGALDYYTNHYEPGCFLRGTVIKCNLLPSLQTLLTRELKGGIYYYGLTSE